jgi:hypothetical protein
MQAINKINIEQKINSINSAYITKLTTNLRRNITDIYYAPKTGLIFVIVGAYIFYSNDNLDTIIDIPEINTYYNNTPIDVLHQSLYNITESIDGTVVIIASDWRKEAPASATDWNASTQFAVWRKTIVSSTFTRTVITLPGYTPGTNVLTRDSNMSAGYMGANHNKIVGFSIYSSQSDPIKGFFYSLDDGLNWLFCDMASYADHHVHSIAFDKSVYTGHASKIWVAIGDDFTGAKAGVYSADTLDGSNNITNWTQIFAERPGYRLVSIVATAKKIYCGNESASGGLLAISNDATSIANGDWEYLLGRNRLDYHQFRSLVVTDDGIICSVSDCYPADNKPHKGQGGYAYISTDEGASFKEISLDFYNSACVGYDGSNFYFAGQWTDGTVGTTYSVNSFIIYKLPKPTPYADLTSPFIVKSPIVDMGGSNHAYIEAGKATPWVDMSPYKEIVVSMESLGACKLRLQASPFKTSPYANSQGTDWVGWHDIKTFEFKSAGRIRYVIPSEEAHNRYFRVFNPSNEDITAKYILFTGRK